MIKLTVALAAAGMLLAAPAFSTANAATAAGVQVAQLEVKIGRDHNRRMHRSRHCENRVTYRHGRKVVVRRCY